MPVTYREFCVRSVGFAVLVLLSSAISVVAARRIEVPQTPPPFTLEKVIEALNKRGLTASQWAAEIRNNKVNFEVSKLTRQDRARLNNAGSHLGRSGYQRLIRALASNYSVVPPPPSLCAGISPTPGNLKVDELIKSGDEALFGIAPRPANALQAYCTALAVAPNDPRVHLRLGDIYTYQERYADALREYQEAVRLKTDFFEAHYALCLAYIRADGDSKSIAREYNAAIQLEPEKGQRWLSGVMLENPLIPTSIVKAANRLFADHASPNQGKASAALSRATVALKALTPGGTIDPQITELGIFHFLKQSIEARLAFPDGPNRVKIALGLPPT